MDWLKLFKQQNKLVLGFAAVASLVGLGLSADSLSGTKYDVIEFCFKPSKAKHPNKFCTTDKRYIVPLGYWKQEEYTPTNPRFQPDDTFILSDKATRLRTIKATNPNAINYAIASCSLLALSTYIVSKRLQRYKREFVLYFEQLKTDLSTQIEVQEQQRDVTKHKVAVETQYIKDLIDRKDMIVRTLDKGELEREFDSTQAERHNELVELQRQLHRAKLLAEIAKQEAERAKFNQECSRYSSRIKSDVEIAEEIDYEALCPGKVGEVEFYDWRYLADEAVGIIIAGNSGCGKTSVATWIAGWLTKDKPAQVLALDPHANRNPLWRELGIEFLQEFGQIEQAMQTLVGILDHRRGLPEGSPEFDDEIIVFADELGACLKQFEDPENIEIALERLGSEGRKYGICFIVLNQSANADDLGISAAMRSNYVLVLLNSAARQKAEKWKKDDPRKQHIDSVAYACMLSGAIADQVAVHPTHHSYSQFKKKGNKPKGILPINQKPLTIQLGVARGLESDWYEDIVEWARQQDTHPSTDAIREKWLEVMGTKPSIKQVELLQEYLTQTK